MKRLIALLVLVAAVMTTVGCGDDAKKPANTSTNTKATGTTDTKKN